LLAKAYSDGSKKKFTDISNKDFVNLSLEQIKTNLMIQTAIHEAKHKVDEYELPDQRLNLDRETSAYLTAAIFSPCPFNGLHSAIEQIRGFRQNVNAQNLNNIFHKLNNLARISLAKDYTHEQLRTELRTIYADYRTISGNTPFVDLTNFENYVVPAIYQAFEK